MAVRMIRNAISPRFAMRILLIRLSFVFLAAIGTLFHVISADFRL